MPVPDSASRERTLAVAARAFERFAHGLRTGDWSGFLDMLSEDFTFYFPQGRWLGEHRGRERAAEFFAYVSRVFPEGLTLTLDRVSASETSVVFEFRDEGTLVVPGQPPRPYRNRVAVSLDVRDGRISGYREYFGSDGASN